MTTGRAAAFFDVDNTIVRGASLFHLARSFRQRGYLRARDIRLDAAQLAELDAAFPPPKKARPLEML